MSQPSYTKWSACRGMDPDLFFPEQHEPDKEAAAKAVCAQCVVAELCLTENLHEVRGVYGGTSARQRKTLRTTARKRTIEESTCSTESAAS